MTFELPYISVAAGGFADIINEARRIAESAEEQRRATRVNVQAWDDAVRRLEGFRTNIAAILGMSSLDDDTRLLDAVRKLANGKPEWQCPVCQQWVLGVDLMCPTCTGDQAQTTVQDATDGERTGRFDPVSQPPAPDPDPDLGYLWGPPANLPAPVAQEPAHALREPASDAQGMSELLSELLSLAGVAITPDYIRNHWSPAQQEQARRWAGSVHYSASDHDDVVVPERPAFLSEQPRCVAHGNETCGLCSLNAAECASQADGGCSTYRDTGMHWDTCANGVITIDDDGVWHTRNGRLIDPATGAVVGTESEGVANDG